MKMIKWLMAALVLLHAVGCSKENIAEETDGNATFPLEISVPPISTKATSVSDEAKVASIQIYVFRSNGDLETYGKGTSNSLVTQCTSGSKTIVALANAPDITDVLTKTALDAKVSGLKDNSPGAFVMYGAVTRDVSTKVSAVTVPVTRLVARVSIQKITNSLELPNLAQTDIKINRIYLVNVAGDMKYTDAEYEETLSRQSAYSPSVWYNKGECKNDGDLPALLNSKALASASASHSAPYSTAHYFYCYPNPSTDDSGSSKCTRLVVEVTIGGKMYYYPLSIPGIKNNHTYNISELVIKHIGSESPDKPVTYSQATFSVTVNPWQEGSNGSVTI